MQKLITKCSDCLPVSPSKFSSPFLPTSLVGIVHHESNKDLYHSLVLWLSILVLGWMIDKIQQKVKMTSFFIQSEKDLCLSLSMICKIQEHSFSRAFWHKKCKFSLIGTYCACVCVGGGTTQGW